MDGAIASDVSNCPDGLFDNFLALGSEQVNEKRNSSLINDGFTLAERSRGNVGEGPSSLELKLGVLLLLNVFDEFGDESSIYNGLDGGEIGDREYFSDADESVVLFDDVGVLDGFDEFGEGFDMIFVFEEPKEIGKWVTFKFPGSTCSRQCSFSCVLRFRGCRGFRVFCRCSSFWRKFPNG